MNRRQFATAAAATVLGGIGAFAQSGTHRFRKGITSGNFPHGQPFPERFKAARNAGFDGMEIAIGDPMGLQTSDDDWKRLRDTAEKSGITIADVWVSGAIADTPLNDDDPKLRAKGVAGLKRGVEIAKLVGTDSILVVPGEVGWSPTMKHGYEQTWERVSAEMPKAIPAAEKAGVSYNFEEVWNRFLTSPLDMKRFVDQFHSKSVAVHFDVGNIFQYGFPQDWINILGSRIRRVHLKDYKMGGFKMGQFVPLLEGSIDWPAVMKALVKTGYRGFLTPEYGPNTPLRDISAAWDKIVAMA